MSGVEVVSQVLTSHDLRALVETETRAFLEAEIRMVLLSAAGMSGVGAVVMGLLHRRVGRWAWARLALLAMFTTGWVTWVPSAIGPDAAFFGGFGGFGGVAASWLFTSVVTVAGPAVFAALLRSTTQTRRPAHTGRAA